MSEIVRVLIPDHPDLCGRIGQALEFGAALCHANDPLCEGEPEAWRLPDQLVAPQLEQALDAILLHDWRFDVGNVYDDKTDTAIGVTHAGVGHMGVYVATATTTQLQLLTAAFDMLAQAETIPPAQRLPLMQDVAEFVEACREADESGEYEGSLSAWRTVVRLLAIAVAPTPTSTHRPPRLYNTQAVLLPVADIEGTSPAADTAAVLDRIDTGDGRSADLDPAAFLAWQRLTAEWHVAIYGAIANNPNHLLKSYCY